MEECFKKIEKRERIPAKIKAVAANGLSFRKTTQVLRQAMGIGVKEIVRKEDRDVFCEFPLLNLRIYLRPPDFKK